MTTKIVKLKEAAEFIGNNGYLLAVYQKNGEKYIKYDDCFDFNDMDIETDIIVEVKGCGIDFREFQSADKQFFFMLHNNFNAPATMPVF